LRRGPPDPVIRCCCSTACRARWRAGRISPTRFKTELLSRLTRPVSARAKLRWFRTRCPCWRISLRGSSTQSARESGCRRILPRRRGRPAVGGRSRRPREPTRAACDGLWSRRGSRASPRCHPTLADAKSRNAVAAPASGGLVLADRCHLDLVQHPRSRLHRRAQPWWSAATTIGPSRRPTVGYSRRASATPALSRSRPDTICKSPAPQRLWPNGRPVSRRADPDGELIRPSEFSRRPAPHRCRIASAPTREPPLRGSARPDRRAR